LMELSCWCRSTSARQCNFCSLTMLLWWMAGDQREYAGAFGQPGYTPRWLNWRWSGCFAGESLLSLWSCIYRVERGAIAWEVSSDKHASAADVRAQRARQRRAFLGQWVILFILSEKVRHQDGPV
jgi:hypothetical protein